MKYHNHYTKMMPQFPVKAATLRHNDGDIRRSIDINQKRFGYSEELRQMLVVAGQIDQVDLLNTLPVI